MMIYRTTFAPTHNQNNVHWESGMNQVSVLSSLVAFIIVYSFSSNKLLYETFAAWAERIIKLTHLSSPISLSYVA